MGHRVAMRAWILGAAAAWPLAAAAAPCAIDVPILPCDIGGTVFDTFAGNFTSNRSFYVADAFDAVVADGALMLTKRDPAGPPAGHAFLSGYGDIVWTSPAPYLRDFGDFGRFNGSTITIADGFKWFGANRPQHYGLFVGSRDSSKLLVGNFDQAAMRVAAAFESRADSHATVLRGDFGGEGDPPGHPVTLQAIHEQLVSIRARMRPGDDFTFFMAGHGGSIPAGKSVLDSAVDLVPGVGDEAVHVGDFVDDNWLADELKGFAGHRVTTFIDACASGGFWGTGDPFETRGRVDLDGLTNVALVAAAVESGLTPIDGSTGIGTFSTRLEQAFRDPGVKTLVDFQQAIADLDRAKFLWATAHLFEAAFGDPVAFDPSLFQVQLFSTPDFELNAPLAPVPEPAGWALLLGGLGMLVASRARPGRRATRAASRP